MHGVNNGGGEGKPDTNPVQQDRKTTAKPPRRGDGGRSAKRGGRVGSKSSTSLKKSDRGVDAMVRVRQDFRQPVTSLWQTATERAATAPTRSVSRGGGLVDSTNAATRRDLSRRRPHSQISSTKDKGGVLSKLSTREANTTTIAPEETGDQRQHVGGKGATFSGADGGNRVNGQRHTSREGEPVDTSITKNTSSAVPVPGSGGQAICGDSRGRKTPMPLRSSHRVGPVGSLGEQGGVRAA